MLSEKIEKTKRIILKNQQTMLNKQKGLMLNNKL